MTTTDRTRQSFKLNEATALLAHTPATLDALLRHLPDGWANAHEGGDTWSAFDVIGHLLHGEQTDWLPRVRTVLEHGESRAFEKFDRHHPTLARYLAEAMKVFADTQLK